MSKLLDVVWLKGTVVEVREDGMRLVEVADDNGQTIALIGLSDAELQVANP